MSLTMQAPKIGNVELFQQRVVGQPFNRTELQQRIGRLPQLIKGIFKVENVFIRLIDEEGCWIRTGVDETVVEERTGKNLCDFTIVREGTLSVSDLDSDPRVRDGSLQNDVAELKSYVGHSLESGLGSRMGVLCAWGSSARTFSAEELAMFEEITFWVEREIASILELDRASEVQRGLLPADDISIPGYEIAGFCQPHLSVGGDFYDWVKTSHGVAFTIADVMGKGIGSAIMAASVRAAIRATSWDHGVQQGMKIASRVLEADLHKAGAFVTLLYAQLDLDSHVVNYIDAGHGLTLHVAKNGEITRMESANFPIGTGLVEEWDVRSINMGHGDTLIMLSDGMLDIFDSSMERVSKLADLALGQTCAVEIIDELKKIVRESSAPDDVTALVLRRD